MDGDQDIGAMNAKEQNPISPAAKEIITQMRKDTMTMQATIMDQNDELRQLRLNQAGTASASAPHNETELQACYKEIEMLRERNQRLSEISKDMKKDMTRLQEQLLSREAKKETTEALRQTSTIHAESAREAALANGRLEKANADLQGQLRQLNEELSQQRISDFQRLATASDPTGKNGPGLLQEEYQRLSQQLSKLRAKHEAQTAAYHKLQGAWKAVNSDLFAVQQHNLALKFEIEDRAQQGQSADSELRRLNLQKDLEHQAECSEWARYAEALDKVDELQRVQSTCQSQARLIKTLQEQVRALGALPMSELQFEQASEIQANHSPFQKRFLKKLSA